MTAAQDYRKVLRKVGLVLTVVGLLDIAVVAYCTARGWTSRDAVMVLAVTAIVALMGAPLIWGSLKWAWLMAFYSAFILSLAAGGMLVFPLALRPPLKLLSLYLRLRPLRASGLVLSLAALVGLVWWTYRMLTKPVVREAIDQRAGRRESPPSFGFAAGPVALAVGLIFMAIFSGGEQGRVREAARKKVGPGYQLFVSGTSICSPGGGPEMVCGEVIAYNDHEIKTVHVKFKRWQ